MVRKWKIAVLAAMIVGGSLTPVIQAEALQLVYDGKVHQYNAPAITLYVNGEKIETTEMAPVQIDGRVLVPAREVFEAMGASVYWEPTTKEVTVTYRGNVLVLTVNQTTANYNGQQVTMDVPGKIINNKVMIPIRFISEQLGFGVEWKEGERAVHVNEPLIEEETKPEIDTGEGQEGTVTLPMPVDVIPATLAPIKNNQYISYANTHESNFTKGSYSKATIATTHIVEKQNIATVTIQANSAMSSAKLAVENGKVIIDIENSTNGLSSHSTPSANSYVKTIRTSQFTATATRVVLDLQSGANVTASFTPDRKAMVIYLKKQSIEEISIKKESGQDRVVLKGIVGTQVQLTEEPHNKTLTLTIPNAYITENFTWHAVGGNYLEKAQWKQVGNNVVGTLTYDQDITYQLIEEKEGLALVVSKPTYKNISYTGGDRPTFSLQVPSDFNENLVTVTDKYRENTLVVDLGKDYSSHFGYGTLLLGDGKVSKVTIATSGGSTKLTFVTDLIYTYNMHTTSGKLAFELLRPREKYNQIVILDAGHGGTDNGASANGLKEKEVNLNQTMAVYRLLEADPTIKVYMTRESDVFPSLKDRTDLANAIDGHMFISIHNNSAGSSAQGTETLYFPSSEKSKELATKVQENLIAELGMVNRGIKARSDLYVLRNTSMPAILIEGGFLSHTGDAGKINTPAFIATYAQAVYEAIVTIFSQW